MYETAPKILRDLIPESEVTTWAAFGKAVRAVSITKLREGIKAEGRHKAIEDRLAEMDRRQRNPPPSHASASAMDDLRRALGGMALGASPPPRAYSAPPITAPVGGAQRGNRLIATYPQAAAPIAPQPPAQARVAYRPAQERLVDLQRTALLHHPDTAIGQAAYAQQVATYLVQHGHIKPHETRPYPLKPGTLPASTGACFKCGMDLPRRHSTRECYSTTPVPASELHYRMVAAVCHGLVRGPQPPEGFAGVAQPVRMIDVTNLSPAQLAKIQSEGVFITELDSGNADGLLA